MFRHLARRRLLRRLFTPPFVTALCAFFLVIGGSIPDMTASGVQYIDHPPSTVT